MNTAQLTEILGGGAAKYSFSPPWKGRKHAVVAPMTLQDGKAPTHVYAMTLPDGKALTYVYAADEPGTMTTATGEGDPTILDTLAGHPSHQQVLSRIGYRLV